uniref:NADH-ubiquinone oxidoreductase chain 2 n=1 Tax=Euphyllodromia sp. Z257 TaxID=2093493 RepID=A0A2P1H9Y1_9NEOP|nr:NADH dehydrogenase subunit 2 [Euphyllodromia sp. Z257]
MMFFLTLMMGAVISISSNSWVGIWMGLEINLLSFIPMMSNSNNIYTTEASLKYFLIQALTSSILLFTILYFTIKDNMFMTMNNSIVHLLLMSTLMMKMAAAPFHWWFPSIMEGLSWSNCFIMMTIQKIAPMIIMSYIMKNSNWYILFIISSIIVGSIGGLNQTSIRKLLTYSSINHLGWMLSAMLVSENMWLMYFSIYTSLIITILLTMKMTKISFINQTHFSYCQPIKKQMFFISLLSLGGLPPFTGFLSKWLIIKSLLNNEMMILTSIMIIFSLITLFYYLQVTYASLVFSYYEPSWNLKYLNNKEMIITLMITFSIIGLLLSPVIIILFT